MLQEVKNLVGKIFRLSHLFRNEVATNWSLLLSSFGWHIKKRLQHNNVTLSVYLPEFHLYTVPSVIKNIQTSY